jgi:hypothetical protein
MSLKDLNYRKVSQRSVSRGGSGVEHQISKVVWSWICENNLIIKFVHDWLLGERRRKRGKEL